MQRRRDHAVTVRKERREALMRTKRLCRVGVSSDEADDDMAMDEEQSVLEDQTVKSVEDLKHAVAYQYAISLLSCFEFIEVLFSKNISGANVLMFSDYYCRQYNQFYLYML